MKSYQNRLLGFKWRLVLVARKVMLLVGLFNLLFFITTSAQTVDVDVNLNVNHMVDSIKTFDRSKFVTIHADVIEPEWDTNWGANFTSNVRAHFLDGYDVYLGRNTGLITGTLNNMKQDPARSGYADVATIESKGSSSISNYASKTSWHQFEHRNSQVLCAQLHPFYPDGKLTSTDWALSQTDTEQTPFGTASGEYMAHFIQDFYGTGGTTGQPKPKLVEIINEPLYFISDLDKVFKYHNSVAAEIKKLNPDVSVGGYTTAFPDLDKNNFSEWNSRMKYFMDYCGENMDFWSIHLYDFPSIGGKEMYRKGSNMEATLDMMEQYSILKFGKAKPFVVSEFGASTHDYQGKWSPYRDWLHIKSANAMMMQFMERPNNIAKTIDFLIIKATWGTTDVNNTYVHRLMRKANEPESYTGTWVYTDMVKIYQLWADVKGKRVDVRSTNPDVLTDAYVDGNTAYVILNNLAFENKSIKLNLNEDDHVALSSLMVKNLYLSEDNALKNMNKPILDTLEYTSDFPVDFVLKPEATMVLKYTFGQELGIDNTSEEKKYYADSYFKQITANNTLRFNVNGVDRGDFGESVLRLGIGRNHGLSLKPTVLVNGTELVVPDNYRGDEQTDRANFFGVIEIPVPYSVLQADNTIDVTFPDGGGYVSSISLRAYKFSKKIVRSNSVSGLTLYPTSLSIGVGQERTLTTSVQPETAVDKRVSWESADASVVTVGADGKIVGVSVGSTTVTATTIDGGYTATCTVEVQHERVPVNVETVNVSPESAEVIVGEKLQLSATLSPADADNTAITWSSTNEGVATVDNTGLVTAKAEGSAVIKASASNGVNATSVITTKTKVQGMVYFDNVNKYRNTVYNTAGTLDVNVTFNSTTGTTVDGEGIKFWLRIIKDRTSWAVVKDYVAYDTSAAGKSSGSASASFSLKDVLPTNQLSGDQFYFLWVSFEQNDGVAITKTPGISPITIELSTAFEELEAPAVKIYPNPANDYLFIEGLANAAIANFFTFTGTKIRSVKVTGNAITVSQLPEGLYFLELANEDGRTVHKLVIQR